MLPQVPVAFLHSSFHRLKAISEHPVVSQYVNTIIFQADLLPKIKSFKEYEHQACLPSQQLTHSTRDTDEQVRLHCPRHLIQFVNKADHSFNGQIREGWKLYKSLYKDQVSAIQALHMDIQLFNTVVGRFPRLTNLRVQTRQTYNEAGMHLVDRPYKNALIGVELPGTDDPFCGHRPLVSLLWGKFLSPRNPLQELSAGLLSWTFFYCPESIFTLCKASVRHLRKLDMEIISCEFDGGVAGEQEEWLRLCIEVFSKGRVLDFVAAAPDLEIIVLLFDALQDYQCVIDLSNVLGDNIWPKLRLLNLRGIEARQDHLLSVFKRHSATLKVLILGDINLCGPKCSWMTVFLQIPEILDLTEAQCHGIFMEIPSRRLISMNDSSSASRIEKMLPWVLCRFERVRLTTPGSDEDFDVVLSRKILLGYLFTHDDEALR